MSTVSDATVTYGNRKEVPFPNGSTLATVRSAFVAPPGGTLRVIGAADERGTLVLDTQALVNGTKYEFVTDDTPQQKKLVTLASGYLLYLYRRLGGHRSCAVYEAYDYQIKRVVAAKFELENIKLPQLMNESRALSTLKNCPSVPRVVHQSSYGAYAVLVTDTIGTSLDRMLQQTGRFPIRVALKIGYKILRIIQHLHKRGVRHGDITPNNIIITEAKQVYLIDFGLATIPRLNMNFSNCYTLSYGPLPTMMGGFSGKFGDLESLAYSLIALVLGKLPWDGKDEQDVIAAKKSFTQEIHKDFPSIFVDFLRYSQHPTGSSPDYQHWVQLFKAAYEQSKTQGKRSRIVDELPQNKRKCV